MTTMNMGAIMDAIAATLVAQGVTTTAQTYAYPEDSFIPPCCIVGYPEAGRVNLDFTFKRGGLEISFPVRVVVAKTIEIDNRNTLSALLDGGAATVKTALESGGGTLGGVVASTQVNQPVVETLHDSLGGAYLAARFDVQVLV